MVDKAKIVFKNGHVMTCNIIEFKMSGGELYVDKINKTIQTPITVTICEENGSELVFDTDDILYMENSEGYRVNYNNVKWVK